MHRLVMTQSTSRSPSGPAPASRRRVPRPPAVARPPRTGHGLRPGMLHAGPAKGCGCDECQAGKSARHELDRALAARPARGLPAPACGVSDGQMGEEAVAQVLAATATADEEVTGAGAVATGAAKAGGPEPPHAGAATIVCDGKGGYRVSLGSWAGAPCGTESCVTAHETQHASDWKGRWPDGCKDKPDGGAIPLGGPGYDAFLKDSECKAHTVDLTCAERLLTSATGDCKAKVQAYVDLTRRQKATYC